jgi:hypothetical protein
MASMEVPAVHQHTFRKSTVGMRGQRGRSRDHRRDGRDDDGKEQRGRYWHGGGARRRR